MGWIESFAFGWLDTASVTSGDGLGFNVMFSTPTANPSPTSPALIALAMFRMDMRPLEQRRLTVEMGTLGGMPAASAAARET